MSDEVLRIDIEIGAINNTEHTLSGVSTNIGRVGDAASRSERSMERLSRRVTQFDRTSEKTQRGLAKWAREKYQVYLEAKERISPVLSKIGGKLKGFAGRAWSVTMKAVDLVTAPVRGIINLLKNPIFQVGAVLGVTVGLSDTINTYKDFESAMSQVKAISGATGSEFNKLTEKAKEMGATTKFTAKEAAEGFNYMAMAGWKTDDMMNGIEGILNLAAASGEDLGTTSDIVTDALTAFGLKASDSGHFADVLAQASSNANTNVSMLGESFKYVAPVAGAMKYSVEDVSLALGLMANASVKGSMAGTSLKTSLARMAAPTKKIAGAMEKYGISLTDSHGKMKSLKELMDNARSSLGGLSEAEQTAAASTIFGKEAMAGMLSIINASERDYKKLTKAVNNADGAAEEMAETMMDNLQGSITLLQSAADGVKNAIGKRLSPYIRGLADMLTDMMPDIQKGLEDLMDLADRGFMKLKKKYKDMIDTDEWKNANLFGKISIAWDEFIAEPFSDWWDRTGRGMVASKAGDIGNAIGSGIHASIMALFGIDVVSTENEGISIGRSFSKGFADGLNFDEISGKLAEGFRNMLSSAGKLLPGGENPDLNSFLSAMVLSKMAMPLITLGGGAVQLGRAVFGRGDNGMSLAGMMIGSAASGRGLMGFGANTAIKLGAGNLAGNASLSAGALSAIGLASTAGGIAGGLSLISGGFDAYNAYKSYKSGNEEKGDAELTSATLKVAGVGAGALVGASIGSVIPVVGTAAGALIGAGIGGIGGWIAGDNEKKEYERKLQEEAEAAKAEERASALLKTTGLDIDKVRFKSETLNQAFHDTEVSAEEFGTMLQEAVNEERASKFGNVSLALKDIKEMADRIVFDKQIKGMESFTEATENATSSLDNLENTVSTIDKLNWKVSFGTKINKDTREDYKETIDEYIQNSKDYVENKKYEATVSMKLLLKGVLKDYGSPLKMIDGMDITYDRAQKQLNRIGKKLSKTLKISLKDGIIDIDEQKELSRLQEKMQGIVEQISNAESDAKIDALKIKYGGTRMDAESYSVFQEQLKANMESMTQNYDDALEVSLSNIRYKLETGDMTQSQFDEQYKLLQEGYREQMKAAADRSETVQLEIIASNYSDELSRIFPNIKGNISDELKKLMDEALKINPTPKEWTKEEIIQWFNLGSLEGVAQEDLAQILQQTAETIPQTIDEALSTTASKPVQIPAIDEMLNGQAVYDSFSMAGGNYANTLASGVSTGINSSSNISLMREATQSAIDASCSEKYSVNATVDVHANYNLVNEYTPKPSQIPQPTPKPAPSPSQSSSVKTGNTSSSVGGRGYANGGLVSGRQLSWVGEEGTEVIIPINPKRRKRALSLYEQAGKMLGVGAFANGGIVGGSYSSYPDVDYSNINSAGELADSFTFGKDNISEGADTDYSPYPVVNMENKEAAPTTVKISVNMTPEFTISGSNGQSEEDIVKIIRKHLKDMADELGGEIADKLGEVFSNMPLREA